MYDRAKEIRERFEHLKASCGPPYYAVAMPVEDVQWLLNRISEVRHEDQATPKDRALCQHERFVASVTVNRVIHGAGMRFVADMTVQCAECREPFRFLGVHAGLDFERPTVSIDGLELRAPIEPEIVKMLFQRSTFVMPPKIPQEGAS